MTTDEDRNEISIKLYVEGNNFLLTPAETTTCSYTSRICTTSIRLTFNSVFPGGSEEEPSADQPSSSSSSHRLLPDGMTRSSGGVPARERQLLLLHPEPRGDGSDLWNLEKMVEELGLKVLRLEEKPCLCANISTKREAPPSGVDTKLQAEVLWLKRGLEDHLSVFKNVFSNADVLAESDATLELDKLWELVKNKDGRKEKKRGGGGGRQGKGGNRRSRRDSAGKRRFSIFIYSSSSLSILY